MVERRRDLKMVKKQLIMEKALELFAKQGFEATSVQQITEHCGISKGAFYLSFKSKEELILALIDQFMGQFTSDIDYRVRSVTNNDELLYEFYYSMFSSFKEHSNFAKILIKEQTQTFNEELIRKTRYYDNLIGDIILSLLERLYGNQVKLTKYDLTYCIKGFLRTYSELFLFYNIPLDINLLSQSLVEKTKLLAKQTTVPFISQEMIEMANYPSNEINTVDQLVAQINQMLEEMEDSIEKESLILLQQQLVETNLSQAIIKGLIENIRNHPRCKWVSFLLRKHFGFNVK